MDINSKREDLIDEHRFKLEQSSLNFRSELVSCIIAYIINGGTRAKHRSSNFEVPYFFSNNSSSYSLPYSELLVSFHTAFLPQISSYK